MDLGIFFGLLGTWVLISWALLGSGDVFMFFDIQSLVLVFGASCTVVIYAIPMRYIKGVFSIIKKALFFQSTPVDKLINDMVGYAEIARRDGILSLENSTKDIEDEFIVQGIQMAVDGTDPELIEQIMNNELENLIDRHEAGKGIFATVGKYAPAFGMIGTLVGLVIMLKNLDDPTAIGPGMAIALLTTLYGALVANGLALPLADRLGRRSAEEVLTKTIIIKGVMAIQSGDNPRIVEQKLRTFLPPSQRISRENAEQKAA
ncbi:MAG: motility protein A [Phycisphaeraceae bacterium]|nr:motility protein A [Phycisphaeraceae bacterium]|tara:strand:- start:1852 stop:2634 length:783 start_codon:yes stop_codon:yes gene_type:complete